MPISYPHLRHETAGMHAIASFARARPDETVASVVKRLRGERPASCELICVTDEGGRLLGTVPAARLLALDGAVPMRDAMDASVPAIGMDEDQETAASLALHHGVDALPLVDRDRVLVGVMPAQALLHVLRREHVEDLHRLAGIRRETTQARHAIEDPLLRRARHRLPWLLIGLLGGALATAAMAGFHETLERTLAAAFFVPALVYLADVIGTQSEAIAVRGLSLTRTGIGAVIGSELRTGMLMGAVLGLVAYCPILIAFGDAALAAAVATSIFVAGSLASAIGIGLPWLFARHGVDPAYGSGPLATVIQDILTIVVYFCVLRAFGV
jgi:magnesium transporter